jgi:hypothetical protein
MIDRRSRHIILAVTAAVLLAFPLRNVCSVLDLTKHYKHLLPTNAETCEWRTGFGADGFEDIVYLSDTSAIGCAGDLGHVFTNSSYYLPGGRQTVCVLISASAAGTIEIEPLEFQFNDAMPPLHLHGLEIIPRTQAPPILVAVNHAFGTVGDTVEMFHVFISNKSLVHVRTLTYRDTLAASLVGVTNDVAPWSPASSSLSVLFVSKYLEQADGPDGRAVGTVRSWLRNAVTRGLLYIRVATGQYNTEVLRCAVTDGPLDCTPAVTGLLMANGVAVVELQPHLHVLITVDVLTHRLVVANAAGPFPIDSYDTPHVRILHAVDNINPSRDPPTCSQLSDSTISCTVTFLAGVVGSVWHASKIESMDDLTHRSPGGTSLLRLAIVARPLTGEILSASLLEERLLVMHDGSFQGTSVGIVIQSTVVMGSFKLNGLLLCQERMK